MGIDHQPLAEQQAECRLAGAGQSILDQLVEMGLGQLQVVRLQLRRAQMRARQPGRHIGTHVADQVGDLAYVLNRKN